MTFKNYHARILFVALLCGFVFVGDQTFFSAAVLAEEALVAPEVVGMSSEKLKAVDEIIQTNLDEEKMIGGIVMIARKGKVCFFKSYGMADRENQKPMQNDAILRIYSMSKAITTAAALKLYDEGKLDFYAPVSKYLPELKELQVVDGDETHLAQNTMTVADLMRHTTGYSYGETENALHNAAYKKNDPFSDQITLADMPARLKKIPLLFEPATRWNYGLSTDLLGCVVEAASGKSLDEFLREEFFEPLGMDDTGFYVPERKWPRFAICYELEEGKFSVKQDEFDKYRAMPKLLSGGGGLVSTAHDYMQFLMMIERGGMLDGKRYLTPLTIRLMKENQLPDEVSWIGFGEDRQEGVGFSFGFRVVEEVKKSDSADRVGEYGWGGAASTHYWISPKDELIVTAYEQVRPYRDLLQTDLKQAIYDAIEE